MNTTYLDQMFRDKSPSAMSRSITSETTYQSIYASNTATPNNTFRESLIDMHQQYIM